MMITAVVRLFSVLCVVLLSSRHSELAIAQGRDFLTLQTDECVIVYPQRLSHVAQQTSRFYPLIRAELETILGLPVDFVPTIQLVNDRRQFTDTVGSDLVVAFAIPLRNLIVIDYTRMVDNPLQLRITLKHELSHLLLHHHIYSAHLPRWLDEGVSQWVTGGVSELVTDPGWSVLETAILRNNLFRFHELVSFPRDRRDVILAYQQSLSFIEYIVGVYGEQALVEILHSMSLGASVDRAFASVLPHSFREVERNWENHIRAQVSWFTYLSRNLFQFIFLAGALLVIIAFIKKVIERRRSRRDDDEADDILP